MVDQLFGAQQKPFLRPKTPASPRSPDEGRPPRRILREAISSQPAAERAPGGEGSCIVLACKYDQPNKNADCPDHLRLDALQRLYPALKVAGCAEYRPPARTLAGVGEAGLWMAVS